MLVPAVVAALIALCCLLAWRASRRVNTGWLGAAWGAYAAYEFLMHSRVLCSGECNIRVDLLLIYPALVAWTVASTIAAAQRRFRRRPV